MERNDGLWNIAACVIAMLGVAWLIAASYYDIHAKRSCDTDHPVNVVMCVDTGQGHHSLMEAMPRP